MNGESTSEIDTVAGAVTNVNAVGNDITNVNCLFVGKEYHKDLLKIYNQIGANQTLIVTSECKDKKEVMINLFQEEKVDENNQERIGVNFIYFLFLK